MVGVEQKVQYTGSTLMLYEKAITYSTDPRAEIARLATLALNEGVITTNYFLALRHRVPFPGHVHETYGQLESRLAVSRVRASDIEHKAARILIRQMPRHSGDLDLMQVPVSSLPWSLHKRESFACAGLMEAYGSDLTVERAITLFNEFAIEQSQNPQLRMNVPYFKQKSYAAVREVFRNVGIELPEIKV